jgi:signal transduction histidine kinase/ActR/RegA family two-component response regulator
LPLDDPRRLTLLRRLGYGEPFPEPPFDRVAGLALQFLRASSAIVSFVSDEHQFFKGAAGLSAEWMESRQTLLSLSVCQLVVRTGEALVIHDVFEDDRLAEVCTVQDLPIASYLGYPISSPDGYVLGSFAVMDTKPRRWTEAEQQLVAELCDLVQHQVSNRHRRMTAETALVETEDRLRQVVRASDCLVWEAAVTFDESGEWAWKTTAYPSGLYQRLLGDPEPSPDGGLYDELQLADGEVMKLCSREAMLSGKHGYQQVFQAQLGDETYWLQETVTIEQIEPRRFHLAGVTTDLSREKVLEERLAAARDAALESSRLKSAFLANMSHELRTPMNAIMGMTHVLLDSSLDSEQREVTEVIRRSSDALLELINQVLDLSKIEANKVTLKNEPFRFDELVHEVIDLLKPSAHNKGLDLRWKFNGVRDEEVLGDAGRLRQVIVNLVGNAVKFTGQGFVEILFSEFAEGPRRRFFCAVRDSGPGIEKAVGRRLFQPFVQGDDGHTRVHGGTGLGLSISKQVIELMGGTIGFSSNPGNGSEFWFEVRLATAKEIQPREPDAVSFPQTGENTALSTAPSTLARRWRLLLAEDNPSNQMVANFLFRRLNVDLVMVGDGEAALEALRGEKFDAVLMDCQMPRLDGFEVTRRIRANTEDGIDSTIPIIAMTAYAMEGDRERCIEVGMNAYVSKPISLASVRAALAEVGLATGS